MSYSTIENFAAGVDRTRERYALEPGSLWEGLNGHITRGGDFEVRKEYVEKFNLVAGTFGCAADAGGLVVFGGGVDPGVPVGVRYQQLQNPDGYSMTKLLDWDLYDGLIYAIAQYSDGSVYHFYNGVRASDWDNGKIRAAMANTDGIAAHLAALIQADPVYATSVVGSVVTVEAAEAGVPFTMTAETVNKTGGADDQTAVVANTVPNVTGTPETLARSSFNITAGTNSAGVNKMTSIKVSGVEILNAAVDWVTSNAVMAANVAAQINAFASAPEYTATSQGDTVTIIAAAGTGATPNGFTVAIDPDGNVAVDGAVAGAVVNKTMTGGLAAVGGQKQKNTVAIGGTFEVGDRFSVVIDGKKFGYKGNPIGVGTLVKTHRRKLYSPAGSVLNFCGVEAPLGWNSLDDAGAGFINLATHQSGSAQITGLAVYQKYLAALSRRVIQIWDMQDDDDNNLPVQFLTQTGTISPDSVLEYGELDVFYLADTGIRSLRARSNVNLAGVQDVGTPIDKPVGDWIKVQLAGVVEAAVAGTEPKDGRFWLAIGTRVFVFSYFPSKKISAWTWYDLAFAPSAFVIAGDRIYARAGDKIYLYGGDGNDVYPDETVTVRCGQPFLSVKKDGTFKNITGMDIAAKGTWNVKYLVDPNDETETVRGTVGELEGVTFQEEENAAMGHFTHIAPVLERVGAGYASVSKITLYYKGGDAKG